MTEKVDASDLASGVDRRSRREGGAASEFWRRFRLAVVVAAIALPFDLLAGYTRARVIDSQPGDYGVFGPAGAALLRGQFGSVYAVSVNQGGPLELLSYGIADVLHVHGTLPWTVFYVVTVFLLCTFFATVALGYFGSTPGRWRSYSALGVVLLGVLGLVLPLAVFLGHPAEVMIPLLWIVAAGLALRNRSIACAALVAFSAGFEVWGVLGAPLLLLAPSPRWIRAAVAAGLMVAVLYLPFIASGAFAMFGFRWTVTRGTLYSYVWPHLDQFPWGLRLVQATVALAAGIAVAVVLRARPYAVWLAPLSIVSVRLLLDPVLEEYYWLAPAVVGLVALMALIARRAWVGAAFAVAVLATTWVAPGYPLPAAAVLVVLATVAVILTARRSPLRT